MKLLEEGEAEEEENSSVLQCEPSVNQTQQPMGVLPVRLFKSSVQNILYIKGLSLIHSKTNCV